MNITVESLMQEFILLQEQVLNLTNDQKQYGGIREELEILKGNCDDFFLVINGMLIVFMQCGFAFVECGAVRSKNATNILVKNMLDLFISGLAYWIIGFPLAFGKGNSFLGYEYFAHFGLPEYKESKFFYTFGIAATAATIVSGSMAERCDFTAYLLYSFALTGIVFPIVCHWAWHPDGWLLVGSTIQIGNGTASTGYVDFAGSGVVHTVGGIAALIGAAFLGPRLNRFTEEEGHKKVKGHSVPLSALGGFILLLGFLATNGGHQLHISRPGDGAAYAQTCYNTIIAASCGAFVGLIWTKISGHVFDLEAKWSMLITLDSSLAGIVAVGASCNAVPSWGAAIIGAIGGASYLFWSWVMVKVRIDDPVDSFAVHAGGGMWGVIAAAFFVPDHGIFYRWDKLAALHLGWQLAGLVSIILWTAAVCSIMFAFLRIIKHLRVSEEIEEKGLDIPKHGEPAYPVEAYGHGWEEKGDALKSMISKTTGLTLMGTPKSSKRITDRLQEELSKSKRPENAEVDKHQQLRRQNKQINSTMNMSNKSGFSSIASTARNTPASSPPTSPRGSPTSPIRSTKLSPLVLNGSSDENAFHFPTPWVLNSTHINKRQRIHDSGINRSYSDDSLTAISHL